MRVSIVYGTLSGNAETCAEKVGARLENEGFEVKVDNISDLDVEHFQNQSILLLSISTYGEGDPPDDAWEMWDAIVEGGGHDFSNLTFAVLALGDTDYDLFCEAGKRFDEAFEKQGGTRLIPRVDCNVDFEEPADQWIESVTAALKEHVKKLETAEVTAS